MSERKPIITVKGLKTHFPVKGTKKVVARCCLDTSFLSVITSAV